MPVERFFDSLQTTPLPWEEFYIGQDGSPDGNPHHQAFMLPQPGGDEGESRAQIQLLLAFYQNLQEAVPQLLIRYTDRNIERITAKRLKSFLWATISTIL